MTSKTSFNPKEHLMQLQGKDYLPVAWRIVWFREANPTGSIATELIAADTTIIIRAVVSTEAGILSTGYGTAPAAGKGSWTGRAIEKAETAAIGRALAHAGYGTQFTDDDEGDSLADSPITPKNGSNTQTPTPPAKNANTPATVASNGTSEAAQQFDAVGAKQLYVDNPDGSITVRKTRTRADVVKLQTKWNALNVSNAEIMTALGVDRASLFEGDYADADERVEEFHKSKEIAF